MACCDPKCPWPGIVGAVGRLFADQDCFAIVAPGFSMSSCVASAVRSTLVATADRIPMYYLVHEQPYLEGAPLTSVTRMNHYNYAFLAKQGAAASSIVDQNKVKRRWEQVNWIGHGETLPRRVHGGTEWLEYRIHFEDSDARPRFGAYPSKCARCDTDWRLHGAAAAEENPLQNRAPIGPTGQVFKSSIRCSPTAFWRQISEEDNRKLIIFTDSRQDAAKLSAGIELDHYRTL